MDDPIERIKDPKLAIVLEKIRSMVGESINSERLREEIMGFKTQRGIYKSQDSPYALWIRQTLKGIYPDKEPDTLPDGSWVYRYSPEKRGEISDPNLPTNQSLFRSMDDGVPLGVFIQRQSSESKAVYDIMGLAYVEDFDGKYFVIHGESIKVENKPMNINNIPRFEPFEKEEYEKISALVTLREPLFRAGIRRIYRNKCSLCEIGYSFHGNLIGVDAAHIISVEDNGTSTDLRNGILLCKNHHSLFDRNLWAFDEDYRVLVSQDRAFRETARNNHILQAEGKKLVNLPEKEYDLPAIEAIKFRLRKFEET
ncbi:MAG: HNH endonuclease [Thermoplasmataceae archaeon]